MRIADYAGKHRSPIPRATEAGGVNRNNWLALAVVNPSRNQT